MASLLPRFASGLASRGAPGLNDIDVTARREMLVLSHTKSSNMPPSSDSPRNNSEQATISGAAAALCGSASAAQERQRIQKPAYGRVAMDAALPKRTGGNRPVPHDDHTMDVADVVCFADEFAPGHTAHRARILARGLHARRLHAFALQLVELLSRRRTPEFRAIHPHGHAIELNLSSDRFGPGVFGLTGFLVGLELPRHLNPKAHLVVAIFPPGGGRFRLRRPRERGQRGQGRGRASQDRHGAPPRQAHLTEYET